MHASSDFAEVREFYDGVRYADDGVAPPPIWHMRRDARRMGLTAGQRLLDVACGTARWLAFTSDSGIDPTGIDISESAIAMARERLPEAEFATGPAESLPFPDGAFDAVTCFGSVEHFVDPVAALREMTRVGTSDARYLIVVPNAGFLTRRLKLFRGTRQAAIREDVRHIAGWEALFRESGLEVVDRWADLHILSWRWIAAGRLWAIPLRAAQALVLPLWPLRWQYQICFLCRPRAA